MILAQAAGLPRTQPDFAHFLISIAVINAGLLIFNMLPIYPLDGGQILQALLWFVVGRARSLMIAGIIGLTAAAGLLVLAIGHLQDTWLALVAVFIAWQAWRGFRMGLGLHRLQPTLDLLNQASSAVRSGRHDEAVEQFTKVINAGGEPGVLAAALTNRGLVESRRGNWQRAIEDCGEALDLQPKLPSRAQQSGLAAGHLPCRWTPQWARGRRTRDLGLSGDRMEPPGFSWHTGRRLCGLGNFDQAVRLQQRALSDPKYCQSFGETTVLARLRLYEQHLPYRLPLEGA